MNIIRIKETDSTNTLMKTMPGIMHGTVVVADTQTAGRGQRGNSWEAEPGKNLTFSMLLEPEHIPARRQFAISRAVALAISDCLSHWLRNSADEIAIKWPNDIYVGDRKICGILIENSLQGDRICRTIVGVGLNVNQTTFRSDAPNPVSMAQIAGFGFDLETLLADLAATILSYFNAEDCSEGTVSEREYAERLWRRTGYHRFKGTKDEGQGTPDFNYELRMTDDKEQRPTDLNYELRRTIDELQGTTDGNCELRMTNDYREEIFEARIVGVDPMGMLTLERRDSSRSTYAFKQIQFIL